MTTEQISSINLLWLISSLVFLSSLLLPENTKSSETIKCQINHFNILDILSLFFN